MIKFQLVSDIHLEMHGGSFAPDHVMPKRHAPILVMAGDIYPAACPDYGEVIRRVTQHFDLVLYVPGNHEFYCEPANGKHSMLELMHKMSDTCRSLPNVRLLSNRSILVGNVGFVGSTLWTDIPSDRWDTASDYLSDYHRIYDSSGIITAKQIAIGHKFFRDRLIRNIDSVVDEGAKKVVVVTHHVPDIALGGRKKNDPSILPFYYCTDMGRALTHPSVAVWCYGHNHDSIYTRLKPFKPLFVTNAIGYPGEHTGWKSGVISV